MRTLFFISTMAIFLSLVGCSSSDSLDEKSSEVIDAPDENQTQIENPDDNNKTENIETPYINPFQPNTEKDPNAPEYIEPVIEREYISGVEVKSLLNIVDIDTQLSKEFLWKINGEVKIASGVQLIVEAGTEIFGENETSSLTFETGSTLIAVGKKDSPIIFTSRKDIETDSSMAGDWGGITLNNTFNSVLKYVQIKYSGGDNRPSLQLIDESYSTVLEFVEIYLSSYDGVEFSGGEVNFRNSIVLGAYGDGISLKDNWSGDMQNIYIEQRDNRFKDKSSGVDIYSIDNSIFSNITIKSSIEDVGAGIYIRDGLDINLYNSIITGERGESCIEAEKLSNSLLESNIIGGCGGGSHKLIDIDEALNYISTNGIDWSIANKIEPINPYSLDGWFDEYRENYIGSYNKNNPNSWWSGWSIGVDE